MKVKYSNRFCQELSVWCQGSGSAKPDLELLRSWRSRTLTIRLGEIAEEYSHLVLLLECVLAEGTISAVIHSRCTQNCA